MKNLDYKYDVIVPKAEMLILNNCYSFFVVFFFFILSIIKRLPRK